MTWLKVVRAVRNLAWFLATAAAGYEVWYFNDRVRRLEMSAPQAASFAGSILVELMALYITVRGVDVAMELWERGLLEGRKLPQPRAIDFPQPPPAPAE